MRLLNKIPEQLRNTENKFYLIKKNSKIPSEKRWNSDNNYCFFETKLLNHLLNGGNYGVVCGYGNLIVLDFDNETFWKKIKDYLPETFVVRTASKKLYHYYYRLKGKMFSKVGIDRCKKCGCSESFRKRFFTGKKTFKGQKVYSYKNVCKKCGGVVVRVCDIQGLGSGVVGPGSSIEGSFYSVWNDKPIKEVSVSFLENVFETKIRSVCGVRLFTDFEDNFLDSGIRKETVDCLVSLGVLRTHKYLFKCPFHEMFGGGNLFVGLDGHLYCFHCGGWWKDFESFRRDFYEKCVLVSKQVR